MNLFAASLKRGVIATCLLLLDIALLSIAMVAAYQWRLHGAWEFVPKLESLDTPSYGFAYGLSIYFVIVQLAALGLYSVDRFRTWQDDYEAIIKAVTISAVLLLALSFFYRQIQYSRQIVLMAWPMAIAALGIGRSVVRSILMALRLQGRLIRDALLLGDGAMLPVILEKFSEQRSWGVRVKGILCDEPPKSDLGPKIIHRGTLAELDRILRHEKVRVVFLVDDDLPHERVLEMIEICERYQVEFLLVPQVYDLLIGTSGLKDFHGMPLVELREEPVKWSSLALKRIFDFILGTGILLVTLPVQIAIAMAIRIDTKGPALFFQERVGYRGKTFRMWKFRSMVTNAEAQLGDLVDLQNMHEPVFKIKNDPRVTRVGRWLRRTSLDELPQLVNVVLGQMSLVGPRPEEVEMVKRYNVWQRRRLKVKPGLTGLQQIKCRGSESLAERVRYDILYIRRLGILLDVEIMFRTVWVVLSQKGAH